MSSDTNASIASRLRRFIYPHRWGAVLTVLAFVGVAATETMIPRLVGYAFGEGFAKDAFRRQSQRQVFAAESDVGGQKAGKRGAAPGVGREFRRRKRAP